MVEKNHLGSLFKRQNLCPHREILGCFFLFVWFFVCLFFCKTNIGGDPEAGTSGTLFGELPVGHMQDLC